MEDTSMTLQLQSESGAFAHTLANNDLKATSTSLSDRVYALLRESIVNAELAPGDRVVESEIARRLGISQAPVREAAKRLTHEGLLTHFPRRGSFVTQVSQADALHARQVREPLEALAGRLSASNVTATDLADLEGIVASMRRVASGADVAAFRDLDIAFHERVSRAAGNPFLVRIWTVLEPSLRALHAIADPLYGGDWAAMAEAHQRLVDVLQSGDPESASAAFASHAAGRDEGSDVSTRPPHATRQRARD
jgi:DNA-binding GntR family transcriptional regulator